MTTLTRGFNEVESIIAKTMEYLGIPAVVGYEQCFLTHLYNDFKSLGLPVFRHPRLLEVRGNDPHSAIICAHIDRHGLISIGDGEYVYAAQYIREIKYGEENRSSKKELESIAGRFEGETIFAYDPKTGKKLGKGIIEVCNPHMKNGDALFYVWGLDDVPQGTPLAYARTAKAEGDQLRGQVDNTISLGVVHALFRAGFQGTALLATEEEIGKSWVHIAEYLEKENIETKDLLVIDTSPYADFHPAEKGMVILRNRDKSECFNEELVNALKDRCDLLGQAYQVKDEMLLAQGKEIDELGSTELGRLVQNFEGRWSGATVQIPTNMYHTSKETTTRQAIKSYFRFLQDILIHDPVKLDIKVKEKA